MSESLAAAFATTLKQTFVTYTVEMVPASDGRHSIRLVSNDGAALVVGFADLVERRAELATIGHALALSKARLGRELPLPPIEYLRFLERASHVLDRFGVTTAVATHAPISAPPPARARHVGPVTPYYGIIAASASILGAIAWLIAH